MKETAASQRYFENADPQLALGCWAFGGQQWGGQEDGDSFAVMEAAVKHGIKHFDTAAAYGNGKSERLIGDFLKNSGADLQIATKGNVRNGSPDSIEKSLCQSLKNLQLEQVELFYLHWPKGGTEVLRSVIDRMQTLREQGKFKALGVSNFTVAQLEDVKGLGKIDTIQLGYNALWRLPEHDTFPYCIENGISIVSYSSLAQGILTGKFSENPTFPKGDQRSQTTFFKPEVWPKIYAGVEKMKSLAAEANRPLAHLATQWAAAQNGVDLVLVGARNLRQMKQNAEAMADPISSGILSRFDDISADIVKHVPDTGNIFDYHP